MGKVKKVELWDGRVVNLSQMSRRQLQELVSELSEELWRKHNDLIDCDEESLEIYVEDPGAMSREDRDLVEHLANTRTVVREHIALLRQRQRIEAAIPPEPAEA